MLYFTGDTHGDQARLLYYMDYKKFAPEDYLIVCGDFGFVFRDNDSEREFIQRLEAFPCTICFVDGNHENFAALNRYPEESWNGGRIHRISKGIIHLMRGQVFTIDGKTLFTMGGAYSIDRYMRKLGESYWEEELPCDAEYKEATANLALHNNQVDYIVTHTAPREMILRMGYNPDVHDLELTGFLEYILYEVSYTHWYCGHWHDDKDITDKFTVLWHEIRNEDNIVR